MIADPDQHGTPLGTSRKRSNMQHTAHAANRLLAALVRQDPFDDLERRHLERTIELITNTPRPLDRTNPATGHITASAVVWAPGPDTIITVYHRKLTAWFQPGGHVESDDATVAAAALRELIEETHLTADEVVLVDTQPFDVDVHPIPAWKNEPAHDHHDIRYLFRLTGPLRRPPTDNVRWMPVDELLTQRDPSLSRLAPKFRQRHADIAEGQ